MEWLVDNTPIWPWVIGFVIGLIIIVDGFFPFVPFQWVGWGKRNLMSKFDIKEWQGQDNYRLKDVAALWSELPPDRPDDPMGKINIFTSMSPGGKQNPLTCVGTMTMR